MPYFVYILFSEQLQKFYIGTTDDVTRRLEEHNSSHYQNSFTVRGIPLDAFLSIECSSSQAAYALEKYIKQMKSAAFIKRLRLDSQLLGDIIRKTERV
jgi:putative endonuclease